MKPIVREIQERLKAIPNLMLLDGHVDVQKVPVFSFLIKCGDKFLHDNFVCALLNDVFGIQSRGGCQCAGPYAQTMLGMQKHNQEVGHWLVHAKDESLRPGVTRVSLPAIGTTPDQQEYVLKAIEWVAKNGWKFMHVYRCNLRTGEWRHKSHPGATLGKKERRWLSHFDPLKCEKHVGRPQMQVSATQAMENANMMLQLVLGDQSSISQSSKMTEDSDDTELRWFVYPKEVVGYIQQGLEQVPGTFDRDQLVGALRSVAWFPQPDVTTVMSEEKKIEKKKPSGDSTSAKVLLNPGIRSSEEEVATRGGKSKLIKPLAKLMRLMMKAMIRLAEVMPAKRNVPADPTGQE
eukprot:scaffold443_cov125-Cylindrotheca_fusiformis.AAC.50